MMAFKVCLDDFRFVHEARSLAEPPSRTVQFESRFQQRFPTDCNITDCKVVTTTDLKTAIATHALHETGGNIGR